MQIAILGSAPSSRMLAPFNDPGWEIWACSPMNYELPRVDAWFELHNLDRKLIPGNEPYSDALKRHDRVYVAYPDKRLPDAIQFEPVPLVDKYTEYFFTSSIAWMMAFAIQQKPSCIGLWGVDMSAHEEYAYQRPGCQFFIREAAMNGIEVMLPPQSDLAEPMPVYAYKEFWPMYHKMQASKKELEERLAHHAKQEKKHEQQRLVIQGAIDYQNYVNNTWLKGKVPWKPVIVEPE